MGADYHPELAEIGKVPLPEGYKEASQKEIALLGESVTVHFAEGRIIGLDYQHLPVLEEKYMKKVNLYPALFQTVIPKEAENDAENVNAKTAKSTTPKSAASAAAGLQGVLLFKRKGDLLLPFLRLNDGRETAASVEGEGGDVNDFNDIPKDSIIEGSTIYFVFVSNISSSLRRKIVDSGNYIVVLNQLHCQVVGIDFSLNPKPITDKEKNARNNRIVYIGLDADLIKVGLNLDKKTVYGITDGNNSYVFQDEFDDMGGINTDSIPDFAPVSEENTKKYSPLYNIYKNQYGCYDKPTLIARTCLHEMSHQILPQEGNLHTTFNEKSTYQSGHYNYATVMKTLTDGNVEPLGQRYRRLFRKKRKVLCTFVL